MKRMLASVAAIVALSWIAPAAAVPGDGAGPDTPGTSASVSPSTLEAGETIHFRVSGFPAGELVNVKIDDGRFCSQSGVHGACVVHQQRIPASGVVSGSLVLPADLKPGNHWLRFLASQEMHDEQGNYLGVKGYTLRGAANFTVTAGAAPAESDPETPGRPAAPDLVGTDASTGVEDPAETSDGIVAAGTPLRLALPDGAAPSAAEPRTGPPSNEPTGDPERPAVDADEVPTPSPSDATHEAAADSVQAAAFPWLGGAVLLVATVAAGVVVRRGLRVRG